VVQFSQIDLMHHLNNASAVELLDSAGGEALAGSEITPAEAKFTIHHYDIKYGDSPRFGDRSEVQSWFEPLPEEGRGFTRFQRITRGQDHDPGPLSLALASTVRQPEQWSIELCTNKR